jgi:hypothetical protein
MIYMWKEHEGGPELIMNRCGKETWIRVQVD